MCSGRPISPVRVLFLPTKHHTALPCRKVVSVVVSLGKVGTGREGKKVATLSFAFRMKEAYHFLGNSVLSFDEVLAGTPGKTFLG